MTIGTSIGTVAAAFSAVTYPFCTVYADVAYGAVCLISSTVGTFFAIIADPLSTFGTLFAAFRTDRAGSFIASAAFIVTFTMILKAVAAVVAHFMVVIAGTAVAAVVFLVAASVSTFAAVITGVAFPVIITVPAAVVAVHTVLVVGRNRNCQAGKKAFHNISAEGQNGMTLFMIVTVMFGRLSLMLITFRKMNVIGIAYIKKSVEQEQCA